MKFYLLIFITFVAAQSLALDHVSSPNHDPSACHSLKAEAQTTLRNMNAAFNMNLQLEFLTRGSNNPQEIEYNRPAQLMDAHSRKEGFLSLPNPCQMPEQTLPSKELYLFILAHEFTHKLMNDELEDPCYQVFLQRGDFSNELSSTGKLHPHFHGAYGSYHANIDIFALKILSHFSIDQRKAHSDFLDFLTENSEITEFNKTPCCLRTRINQVANVIPTSFHRADDFIPSGFLSGIPNIQHFLGQNHPNSTFIRDLDQRFPESINGCYYPKVEDQSKTSAYFTQLQSEEMQSSLRRQVSAP